MSVIQSNTNQDDSLSWNAVQNLATQNFSTEEERAQRIGAIATRILSLPEQEKPDWWKNQEQRYTFCRTAASFGDKNTVQQISALEMNQEAQNLETVADIVGIAAYKGWNDVCKNFLSHNVSLISLDSTGRATWQNLIDAFPNNLNDMISLEDYVSKTIQQYNSICDYVAAYFFVKAEVAGFEIPTCFTSPKIQKMLSSQPLQEYLIGCACKEEDDSMIKKLVSLNIPIYSDQLIDIATTFGANSANWVTKNTRLKNSETNTLLVDLIATNTDIAQYYATKLFDLLFETIGTSEQPQWLTKEAITDIFFALLHSQNETNIQLAKKLLPHLNAKRIDYKNNHQTALMVALENNFSASEIEGLLSKSSLFHADITGKTAFSLLCEKQAVPVSHTAILQCVQRCGIPSQALASCTTYQSLHTFLVNAIGATNVPVLTRVLLSLLIKKESLGTILKTKNLTVGLALLHPIEQICGIDVQDSFINAVFEINGAHLKYQTFNADIPKKDSSLNIETLLLQLYDTYATKKSDDRREKLTYFIHLVTNKVAYKGTPPEGSQALDDFYATIDNATCSSAKKMIDDMSRHNQTSQFTEDIQARIDQFLDEYIAAATECGGRLISTASQQYFRIAQGRSLDFKDTMYSLASFQRESIVNRFAMEKTKPGREGRYEVLQSTHAYNAIMKELGENFAINGFAALQGFEDVFSEGHEGQIALAKKEFLQMYSPANIARYMRDRLEDDPQNSQFATQLQQHAHKEWSDLYVPEIMKKVQEIIRTHNEENVVMSSSTSTKKRHSDSSENSSQKRQRAEESAQPAATSASTQTSLSSSFSPTLQQKITDYFMREPFCILITDEDLLSLKTIEDALRKHPQLYLALNREKKSYTLQSILTELCHLEIIKPVNLAESDRAVYDSEYRKGLMTKLMVTCSGDFSRLSTQEQEQIQRAGHLITSCSLFDTTSTTDVCNAKVKKLLSLFPNLETLDLSCSQLSTLSTLPKTLKNFSISYNEKLTSVDQNLFSACTQLEKFSLDHCSAITTCTCTLPNTTKSIFISHCDTLSTLSNTLCSQCTQLEEVAVYDCNSLTKWNSSLPATVKTFSLVRCKNIALIDTTAFSNCRQLEKLCCSDCSSLSEFTSPLPSSLQDFIADNCTSLRTIADTVFVHCTSLQSASFENCAKLTSLGESNFARATHLLSLNFFGCEALTAFNCALPNTMKSISFNGCIRLETIHENAFTACSELEELFLRNCESLTRFVSPLNSKFYLKTIDLTGCISLVEIGSTVFSQCTNLESINLRDCVALQQFNCILPSHVETIDFYGCTSLASIGDDVFSNTGSITILSLPSCESLQAFNCTFRQAASVKIQYVTDDRIFTNEKRTALQTTYPTIHFTFEEC